MAFGHCAKFCAIRLWRRLTALEIWTTVNFYGKQSRRVWHLFSGLIIDCVLPDWPEKISAATVFYVRTHVCTIFCRCTGLSAVEHSERSVTVVTAIQWLAPMWFRFFQILNTPGGCFFYWESCAGGVFGHALLVCSARWKMLDATEFYTLYACVDMHCLHFKLPFFFPFFPPLVRDWCLLVLWFVCSFVSSRVCEKSQPIFVHSCCNRHRANKLHCRVTAKMISAVMLINMKGEIIVSRFYRFA